MEPHIVEGWLLMIEKIFDNMRCLENKKVLPAMCLFERETKRWHIRQQQEKFQGMMNVEISWLEFIVIFKD